MNAIAKPWREVEPNEVFDTIASVRSRRECKARFGERQPIPRLPVDGAPAKRAARMVVHVFVMDVRPGMAEFTKAALEQAGLGVWAFDDHTVAGHAFAFASPSPQLLVVHDSMVSSLGLELVSACQAINPGVRVIVMRDHPTGPGGHDPIPADVVHHQPYCDSLLVREARRLSGPLPRIAAASPLDPVR